MWKLLGLVVLVACAQKESKIDPALTATPLPAGHPVAATTAPDTAQLERRLAQLERKVDRVVTLLEQQLPPSAPGVDTTYSVPVDPIDPVRGPANAKVTIVEVFEFPCVGCQSLASVLDGALAKWPADVRVVSKYLPVHGSSAVMPGLVACAAFKQGKYEATKAALWKVDGANVDAVKQAAVAAGADRGKLDGDLVACQAWLQNSQATLRALGVTAAPTLFVNGKFAEGALTQPIVEGMVTEALAKATEAIGAGVAQDRYYQQEIVDKGTKTAKSRFDD